MYALRPATADDFDFLFALHRAAMRTYIEPIWGWHEDWQLEYFRKKFEPTQRQIIVVNGRDAGVLVVENRPDEIYIGLIELMPDIQGQGIGTALLGRIKSEARDKNVPVGLHVLRTNGAARRLYERFGFRVVDEEAHRVHMICRM